MGFITKPVYTPPAKIRSSLYTDGKEYSDGETYQEYIGLYHIYPNGAVYSEASYMTNISRPLMSYVVQGEEAPILDISGKDTGITGINNLQYFSVTEARFHNHYAPPYFYPRPLKRDYDVGYFSRIFVQKINSTTDLTEISLDESERINTDNSPGIDGAIYKRAIIEWTIDGPIDSVRKANKRSIIFAMQQHNIIGLDLYLSDLDEFHKDYHKIPESKHLNIENDLYTDGGKYQTLNGQEYIGPYHIHPEKGPMVGKIHTKEKHAYLKPIKGQQISKPIKLTDSGQSSYY